MVGNNGVVHADHTGEVSNDTVSRLQRRTVRVRTKTYQRRTG